MAVTARSETRQRARDPVSPKGVSATWTRRGLRARSSGQPRTGEVYRQAALGGVHGEPEERTLGVGDAAPEGRAAARRVARTRLDLHHVGAEVAEELAGEEAGLVRQVEHADAVEVAGQRCHARVAHPGGPYPIAPVWC